jgi:hypothetical protein
MLLPVALVVLVVLVVWVVDCEMVILSYIFNLGRSKMKSTINFLMNYKALF